MVNSGKKAALDALRSQLGGKVVSGTEFLQQRENHEACLPTHLPGLDEALGGGLPRGQLTEMIGSSVSSGSGLVMAELLALARRERRYVMLLDVGRGFTPWSFPDRDLEVLLWVGCDNAKMAIEALDVATRDENFSLFLVDLRDSEASDWKSVRSSQWYRILGQMRQRETAAVLFASAPVTAASKVRVEVAIPMPLASLNENRVELVRQGQFRRTHFASDQKPNRRAYSVEALQAG